MKAQSLRRTLWFVDFLLVSALVGAGAWYVLKVRPASAGSPQETAWADAAWQMYHKEDIHRIDVYPVKSEKELDAIVREDLRDRKTRDATTIVGVFVGLPPPEPKPPEAAKVVEGPKDLDALGKALMVIYRAPPGVTSVLWAFTDAKAGGHQAFSVGEFIRASRSDKGRFRMTNLVANPESPKWKLVFDVYDDVVIDNKTGLPADAKAQPTRKDQELLFELKTVQGKEGVIHPATQPGKPGTPGAPPAPTAPGNGAGGPTVVAGTPPPLAQVRLPIQKNGNNYNVEFDQNTYDYVMGNNAEALMEAVKTSVAKDDKGNDKGLMITGIQSESLANQFEVKPGDILISINAQMVHSRADAVNIVKGLSRDTKLVTVVIERNGRQIVYNVDPRDPKVRGQESRIKFK